MDNDTLSLLGCTSVLAFALVVGNSANAATEKQKPASVANAKPAAVKTVSASSKNVKYGDAAVEKFQCDCPPCRRAIVRMVQSGQINL
jgi:hypothetical protein